MATERESYKVLFLVPECTNFAEWVTKGSSWKAVAYTVHYSMRFIMWFFNNSLLHAL